LQKPRYKSKLILVFNPYNIGTSE